MTRVQKIKIRQSALTDFYWLFVKGIVDFDTHVCDFRDKCAKKVSVSCLVSVAFVS